MIRLERVQRGEAAAETVAATLTLPFELRRRSRLLVRLDDGEEGGLFLERGTVLRDGDQLAAADGRFVRIVAAAERVYRIGATVACPLARAAYHLGNRHIPVELREDHLLLERDPVLRAMLLQLGATVVEELAPFEPEPGADGGGHRHNDGDHVEEYGLAQSVYASRHGGAKARTE